MDYLLFSLGFILIHTAAYMLAGAITYPIIHRGHPIYEHYLRREEEKDEWSKTMRLLIPAQLLRGLLLSVVFFPVLGFLGGQSLLLNIVFLFGILFVVGGLASQVPFPGNIEGIVYVRDKFREGSLRFYVEDLIYCPIVAVLVSLILI